MVQTVQTFATSAFRFKGGAAPKGEMRASRQANDASGRSMGVWFKAEGARALAVATEVHGL